MPKSRIEDVTAGECWKLLSTTSVGRLAVVADEGVDIFPVNFLVKDETIYFASAPGTKLVLLTRHPIVAFEADGIVDRLRWSVVVKGRAERLGQEEEIRQSGVLELASLNPTEKWNYVRISPQQVTGRRFAGVHNLSSRAVDFGD